MTTPIKVGMLSPYSGVYPYYAHHLTAGMLLGLYPGAVKKNEFEFIPAYTKMGDPASTTEAVNKLIFFDRADIISGLINYRSIPDIIPVIERHNKLALFFDMGELIPWFSYLSSRIFYCSQQVWQSQYALGYWAGKEYGKGGMMIMTIYEAGYHISSAFYRGVADAGADPIEMHIVDHDKRAPSEMDLEVFFGKVKKNNPSYVHAIFAGSLGNDFLARWRASGFYKQIPLVVAENMVYDDMLQDAASLDLEMYSASTWSRADDTPRNKEFVKKFENLGGQMANIYGLMGYEAGLALRELKPLIQKRDWNKVADLLQKESIVGPRGERNFYPASGFSLPLIDIISVKTSKNNIFKTVVAQGKGLKFDAKAFMEIHENSVSGWQNPYLCV